MDSQYSDQSIVSNAHQHIDMDYLTRKLQEKSPRKSKLSHYFDSFMEFSRSPPPLSPSPTNSRGSTPDPESIDHSSDSDASHVHTRTTKFSQVFRSRIAKVPSRMSSLDSEDGRLIHDKLRTRHRHLKRGLKRGEFRISKRYNLHPMRTRSKKKTGGAKKHQVNGFQ